MQLGALRDVDARLLAPRDVVALQASLAVLADEDADVAAADLAHVPFQRERGRGGIRHCQQTVAIII